MLVILKWFKSRPGGRMLLAELNVLIHGGLGGALTCVGKPLIAPDDLILGST